MLSVRQVSTSNFQTLGWADWRAKKVVRRASPGNFRRLRYPQLGF